MRLTAFLTGILLILLALLARLIGIDHDAAWGVSRYLLLFSGLALVTAAALAHLYQTGRTSAALWRVAASLFCAVYNGLEQTRRAVWISVALTIVLLLAVSLYASWYTSFGLFPRFIRVTNPYVDLGEAFLHGQVALLAQPDPQLVALPNPYDAGQREKVPYLWDLSYYQGKYYAYWGPAPALLYAAVQAVTRTPPTDQLGVLVFYSGLGVILAMLLFWTRRRLFPRAPGLSIPMFLLALLVNLPVMYILERCQVYETSAIAGQFFILFGLLAWLQSPDGDKPGWLLATGLSWGLAIGARYNLALTAALLVAFALYRLWRACGWSRAGLRPAAALLAPLALCGLALALYNYARFDNPFETGLVYQLTVSVYQNRHFSPAFFLSSLYVYLFYPLSTRPTFPFFPSLPFDFSRLPAWAVPPRGKLFDEVFFGIGQSLPVLWLSACISAVMVVRGVSKAITPGPQRTAHPKPGAEIPAAHPMPALQKPAAFRRELIGVLSLSALLQFIFLLFYYFTANRFIIDFLFLALLALLFLAWEADDLLTHAKGRPWAAAARATFWLAAVLLVLATAFIAVLAGFDIVPQFFRLYNPALYQLIAARFNQVAAALLVLPESPGLLGAALRLLIRLIP